MNFLASIIAWLQNVPPFGVVMPDEGGVYIRGGRYKRTLAPGFYLKWPIYDSIKTVSVKEQVVELASQSVTAKDGRTLALGGAIKYEVSDPRKALLEVYDYDTSLSNLALGVIASYVSRAKDASYDAICREVLSELQVEAESWGLEILDFWLTDNAKHRVIRLMQDRAVE